MSTSRLTSLLPLLALLAPTTAQQSPLPQWVSPTPSWVGTDAHLDFSKSAVLKGVSGHPRPLWCAGAYKMPSDPAGTWTLSFTVRALQGYGNPGFSGLLLAKWTPGAANPLVLTKQAAAANDAFVDYNMVLEPITRDAAGKRIGGRYGTFDRFQFVEGVLTYVGPYLSYRADDTKDFGKAMPIAGLTGVQEFADPVTGHVGGKLKIFYVARQKNSQGTLVDGVWMDDLLNPSTSPKAAGRPVLVTGPAPGASIAHAPIPLNGDDGQTKGLLVCMADANFAWSQIYFAADLDPATPAVYITGDQTQFLSGGGSAGGELFYHTRANENLPRLVDSAFLLGDTVAPGGTAEVNMTAYSRPGTQAQVAVFASPRWLPGTVQLPGVLGALGISPAIKLGSVTCSTDQVAHFRFPVPNVAQVRGLDLNVQGLAVFTDRNGRPSNALTNTAQVRVR